MAAGYDIGPRIGIQGEKEFNNQIKQINNVLRECGSEMNALTGKFAENQDSQEALIAKGKVLGKQYEAQRQKSGILQAQYEKEVAKLRQLADAYQKMKKETGEASAETARAEAAYNKQTETVSKLKVSINETDGYIGKLSASLEQNRKSLEEVESSAQGTAEQLDTLGRQAQQAGDDLGGIGEKLDLNNLMEAADKIAELGDQVFDMAENSKEHISIMGQLAASSADAGYTAAQTEETYKKLFGVLGDDQTAATTTANLQALGLKQEDLNRIVEMAIGGWAKYGDSIPIDGLAEAINETAKTGQVTGVLADALNWAGTNEEEFNKKLEKTAGESQRANMIMQELAKLGLEEVGNQFQKQNAALVENNRAQAEYQEAMAKMGERMLPVMTMMTETVTGLLGVINAMPEPVMWVIGAIALLAKGAGALAPVIVAVQSAMSLHAASSAAAAAATTAAGTAAGGAAVGFGALSASMLPVIAIIAAVIAAITGIILVIKNWDSITQWFKDRWASAMETIPKVVDKAKKGLRRKYDEINEMTGGRLDELNKLTEKKMERIRKSYEDAGGGFKGAMSAALTAVKEAATKKYDELDIITGGSLTRIKNKITGGFREAATEVKVRLTAMRDDAAAKMEAIGNKAAQAAEKMKNGFANGIEKAWSAVKNGADKLKKAFDFEWKLPDIKLPHFKVEGKFSLKPPSAPKFSVDWYKNGGILSGAQIFGRMGDKFLGGGEAGKELVLPLTDFYTKLDQIIQGAMRGMQRDYSGMRTMVYEPKITVMVGNREFDAYIIKTADKGLSNRIQTGIRMKGKV